MADADSVFADFTASLLVAKDFVSVFPLLNQNSLQVLADEGRAVFAAELQREGGWESLGEKELLAVAKARPVEALAPEATRVARYLAAGNADGVAELAAYIALLSIIFQSE